MPKLTLSHGRVFIHSHASQPSDPTLLLLHGAGGSHRDWPPALRTLPDANVIAIDLPGHGNDASDDPPLTSVEAMADCVQELADKLSALGVGIGNGNCYAYRLVKALGIDPDEGVARISFVHYTCPTEIKQLISSLEQLL